MLCKQVKFLTCLRVVKPNLSTACYREVLAIGRIRDFAYRTFVEAALVPSGKSDCVKSWAKVFAVNANMATQINEMENLFFMNLSFYFRINTCLKGVRPGTKL